MDREAKLHELGDELLRSADPAWECTARRTLCSNGGFGNTPAVEGHTAQKPAAKPLASRQDLEHFHSLSQAEKEAFEKECGLSEEQIVQSRKKLKTMLLATPQAKPTNAVGKPVAVTEPAPVPGKRYAPQSADDPDPENQDRNAQECLEQQSEGLELRQR